MAYNIIGSYDSILGSHYSEKGAWYMSIDTQCYPIKCAILKGAKQGVGKFRQPNLFGIFNKNQMVKSPKRKSVGDTIS